MTKHSNPAVRMNWSAVLVSVLLGVLLFLGVFFLSNTSPAEARSYPIVRSCKDLTVKQVGKSWVTVKKSNGARVNYTGVAENSNGWWRVVGGVVDFKYTGIAENDYGWWRIENGKVLSNYEGIIANNHGAWYVKNGTVQFGFTGTYHGYAIQNGKVAGKAA